MDQLSTSVSGWAKARVFALLSLALFPLTLLAAPPPAFGTGLDNALGDLAWIAGRWQGGQGETLIEEHWTAPASGGMMGMFRMVREGEVAFYELMAIEPGETAPVLRIKHFSAGLVGWEEKDEAVTFSLVRTGPREAVFEGQEEGGTTRLTYRGTEAGGLSLVLEKEREGKAPSRSEFRFERR